MTKEFKRLFLKDLRRTWPGLLISAICLVAVFYIADPQKLVDAMRLADYRYFPPALAVFILSILSRTMAWRTLLKEQVSFRRVFLTLNEGYLLNNVLPFRLGEVGRAFLMSRTSKLRFFQVVSTILVERAFDIIIVVGILLGTLPLVIGASGSTETDWALPTAITLGGGMLLALLALHLMARYSDWVLNTFVKLQQRISPLRRAKPDQLNTFLQGLAALTELSRFLKVLGWMLLAWFLIVLEYYLILLAFFPGANFVWAAFGIAVVGLGVAVPAAPGGVGVVQGTIVAVFALFAIDHSAALAYSITVHVIYLAITSSLGVYGLVRDGESLLEVYEQVRARINGRAVRNA